MRIRLTSMRTACLGFAVAVAAANVDGPADQDFMEAIYGQLFILGPNGKILPDLATGYSISPDAKTVTITLRHGVKFTDGTPFNAQAVVWNWERELAPGAIEAKGPYTVVVHQSTADSAFVDQLF